MTTLTLLSDNVDAYKRILALVGRLCERVQFIVRTEHAGAKSDAELRAIEPWRLTQRVVSSWPGTILFDGTATLSEYALNPEVDAFLKTKAQRFSEWVAPGLPEDLCFLRQDGSWLLASVTHEGDVFIEVSNDERHELALMYPDFLALFSAEGAGN